jgi:hypothetical protein
MHFEVVGVTNIRIIALSRQIRQLERLKELYGKGRWRKMKGETLIRVTSGAVRRPRYTGVRRTALGREI